MYVRRVLFIVPSFFALFLYVKSGKAFVADCVGCLNAPGCYYCPEDGTCENSDMYSSTNSNRQCTSRGDYYSTAYGDTAADKCTNIPNAYYNDPLWEGSAWVYESIQVRAVWEQYQLEGTGITIRINDDGVYTDHIEFDGRFAALDQSCSAYAPLADDTEGHGTAVAGILVGNANNAACSAGIASQAKFSSCNFFAPNVPYSSLAYKLHTFDISQNSIGMPYVFFVRSFSSHYADATARVLLCTSVLHHRDGSSKSHALSCCLFLFCSVLFCSVLFCSVYLLSTDITVPAVFIVRVVAKDW